MPDIQYNKLTHDFFNSTAVVKSIAVSATLFAERTFGSHEEFALFFKSMKAISCEMEKIEILYKEAVSLKAE